MQIIDEAGALLLLEAVIRRARRDAESRTPRLRAEAAAFLQEIAPGWKGAAEQCHPPERLKMPGKADHKQRKTYAKEPSL